MTKKEMRTYKNTFCTYNCSCGEDDVCPGENKTIYITRLKIPVGDSAVTIFYVLPEELKTRQVLLHQGRFEHILTKLI